LAGVGLSQIEKIKKKIRALKDVYHFYRNALNDLDYIKLIEVNIQQGELPLWIEAICIERDKVINLLKSKNIQTKPFFPPLNKLPYLSNRKRFKYSKFYADYGLTLPSGPDQSIEDLKYVIRILKEIGRNICFNVN
ncbi:DegT/DnrJ/EryC1/StrS family aminotransferase, partial [Patescibacteria group bacterium]|nr:DegT/DnrJ/EryC1/StrS family aminotransferase [Patescibacteria group bacterium]